MKRQKRNIFESVSNINPGKSMFDLSYEKKFTCDMGQLIPIMCDEAVPGDVFNIGNECVVRFQPLVAPILHEINIYTHYYFVPYRLLWDDWEDFITGGEHGDDASTLPYWTPTNPTGYALGTLWDYFGFPLTIDPGAGARPLDFPRRAYNFVYNEYYRDENLTDPTALTNELVLNRMWEKDYFTSALPWQQKGIAPALPIAGMSSAVWPATVTIGATEAIPVQVNSGVDPRLYGTSATGAANILGALNANTVDLSMATTFDVADLRLAFQIQRWMERNARAGSRYTEFLKSHFGVSPRDERLDRPEYIGGSKSPVIISEVLQTSETDTTPQGTLAGHGLSVGQGMIGKYRVEEYGLIIGLMSIMPRTAYQQGINRQWLRRTKYDFYFPEFANLSEQAIERGEIFTTAVPADNIALFAYQGRYDELRTKQSMVCSEMRTTFDYWHLSRQFPGPAAPVMNETFLTCTPRKDIFAVPSSPGLIVNYANLITAYRPLPTSAEPGLIDHS